MNKIKLLKFRKINTERIGIILLFTFIFFLSAIQAQEVIPATGGNAAGSGGKVSYTVGQVVYTTISGSNGSVAEGVQQPYEISENIGIRKAENISLSCSVYPNPTIDDLYLKTDDYKISKLYFQLYALNGQLLKSEKITSNESKISFADFPSGTYLLKVVKMKYKSEKEIKTFKIVKNH